MHHIEVTRRRGIFLANADQIRSVEGVEAIRALARTWLADDAAAPALADVEEVLDARVRELGYESPPLPIRLHRDA